MTIKPIVTDQWDRCRYMLTSLRPAFSDLARLSEDADHSLAAQFRAFISKARFPCLGAKAALSRGGMRFIVARDLRSDADDMRILAGLFDSAAHYRRDPRLFQALVVLFEVGAPPDEKEFERLFWARLQSLGDMDERLGQTPDPRVAKDPDDPDFAISFGNEAYFVVGLGPCSSRPGRRFPKAAIVFNIHDQFERLRAAGRYQRLRSTIIERDRALAGSVNPMLAEHGTISAARQYSGREVGEDWRCPFRRPGGAAPDTGR